MEYFMSQNNSKKLFVLLHGTGGNEFSLLFLTGELDPTADVISFVSNNGTGENRRFFAPLTDGQLEQGSFDDAVTDFIQTWDNLALDYDEITFVGYSNGANLMQGILQQRPDIADKTILMHPQQFGFDFSQVKSEKNNVLLTTGANDTLVVPGDILNLQKQLEPQFKSATLILTDGYHEVGDREVQEIKEWYHRLGK